MTTHPFLLACALLVPLSLVAGCDGDVTSGPGGSGGSGATGGSGGSGATGGGTGATGGGTGGSGATGGGTGATGGGTGGAGATGGSGGSGAGPNSGDCDSDADCPGSKCVEITPGGFRVCKTSYAPAEACSQPGFDECCSSADCEPGEVCFPAPLTPYCGGPAPAEYNLCGKAQCAADVECGDGVCAPAGTLGNKVTACYAAGCLLDSDCTAASGGICAPVVEPCCSQPVGLFCVYPGGCRSSSDCKAGEYCQIQPDGATECILGEVLCPA